MRDFTSSFLPPSASAISTHEKYDVSSTPSVRSSTACRMHCLAWRIGVHAAPASAPWPSLRDWDPVSPCMMRILGLYDCASARSARTGSTVDVSSGWYEWYDSTSIASAMPVASAVSAYSSVRFVANIHTTPPITVASGCAARMAAAVSAQNRPYSAALRPCFQHQSPSGSFQISQ